VISRLAVWACALENWSVCHSRKGGDLILKI
jgi:hypothetical protein